MDLTAYRELQDRDFARDVLRARSDFLSLRNNHERNLRRLYIRAADRVAADLRKLNPKAAKLTKRQLAALERSLRQEAERLQHGIAGMIFSGIEEAVELGGRPLGNHLVRSFAAAKIPVGGTKLQWAFASANRAAVEMLWARRIKGLNVSDRIWKASRKSRDTMRSIVLDGLASGRDAVQVAKDLQGYVRSGRKTLAKDLSYEALRLARTEYTHAFAEGTYLRGNSTPSYLGVRWVLSEAHDVYDVCDELAAADLYDLGPGVYRKGEEPAVPHPNCYDDTTEVFTDRGWMLFADLQGGEKILSMDPETSRIEWVDYVERIAYQYAGDMIHFGSHNFDMLVTPNHRMVVGKGNKKQWEIVAAEDLLAEGIGKFRIPRTAEWIGDELSTIEFGGLVFPAETFCRFMAYYLSDGSTNKRGPNSFQISISKTGPDQAVIVRDLEDMPIKVNVGQSLYMHDVGLGKELDKLGKCTDKYVPEIIKRLSPRLIRIFLDAYALCDGHERESRWDAASLRSTERTYFTTSKRLADDLGELIVKSGRYPSYSLRHDAGKRIQFGNGEYTVNHNLWVIRENRSKAAWFHPNENKGLKISRVAYDGWVHDVELERNHVLWVRRDGKTAWSGNCRCNQVPALMDTDEFVNDLIEWRENPEAESVSYINDWYKEFVEEAT